MGASIARPYRQGSAPGLGTSFERNGAAIMNPIAPTSLLDWHIYQDAFSTERMRDIFNERAACAAWLEMERAVAVAQGRLGIIPKPAAEAIAQQISADRIDLQRLREDVRDVGRPIVGLVKQLVEQIDEPHGQWVHFGISTYDVIDSGAVLQIKSGIWEVQSHLTDLRVRWEDLARQHRDTIMIGRTNGQHAQPTTFGAKIATWIEECVRQQQALHFASDHATVLQLGSMVGSLAAFETQGLELREEVARELGLSAPLSNWHNARDGVARVVQALGLICASLARIARDIASLSSTDMGELSERGELGRGRSSGMPHKRNPRAAEFAEATARLGRQRSAGVLEMMGQEHERSGGTFIAEWVIVPETFLLTSGAIAWMTDLMDRLEVHEHRMVANIDATCGLALSERWTLFLAAKLGKSAARQIVDQACARAYAEKSSLAEAITSIPEAESVLTQDEINQLSDPKSYLGSAGEIVDTVLAYSQQHRFRG